MKANSYRIVGLELTDPFSRAERPIAMAEIPRSRRGTRPLIRICQPVKWPRFVGECTRKVARQIVASAGIPSDAATLLVIDGPQALAAPGQPLRECERATRTPGRTPDREPDPGPPFAGYIRGSVQLFRALLEDDRWRLLSDSKDRSATLLEAFPGDAWRRLSNVQLAAKVKRRGRQQRLDLLRSSFELDGPELPSHDELDAAMCAALGYWWTQETTEQLGNPPAFREGHWREGYIVTPRALGHRLAAPRPRISRRTPPANDVNRVQQTWGYRCTGTIASKASTFELATTHNVLVRTVFNTGCRRIANVRKIRPEDRILIVHSHRGRTDWLQAVVDEPGPEIPPIQGYEADFPAFGEINEPELIAHLEHLRYRRDAVRKRYTALLLKEVERCGDPPNTLPAGRNAIWLIT